MDKLLLTPAHIHPHLKVFGERQSFIFEMPWSYAQLKSLFYPRTNIPSHLFLEFINAFYGGYRFDHQTSAEEAEGIFSLFSFRNNSPKGAELLRFLKDKAQFLVPVSGLDPEEDQHFVTRHYLASSQESQKITLKGAVNAEGLLSSPLETSLSDIQILKNPKLRFQWDIPRLASSPSVEWIAPENRHFEMRFGTPSKNRWRILTNDSQFWLIKNTQTIFYVEGDTSPTQLTFSVPVSFSKIALKDVGDPQQPTDATPKAYVDARSPALWDIKTSLREDDHQGWILWTGGRRLVKAQYQNMWNSLPSYLIAKGLVKDLGSMFEMGDIGGRYLGIAGSGEGLTPRDAGDRVGQEAIDQVPTHDHDMTHGHTARTANSSHAHDFVHTHSMNHEHPHVVTTTNTHDHSFNLINNTGTSVTGIRAEGGTGNSPAIQNVNSNQHAHAVDIPPYEGSTGHPSSSLTGSNTHNHSVTLDDYLGKTKASGAASVDVMNPGIFVNIFVYSGAL